MDKRHFTVVIGSKEHGLYISSKPSSAAKKAVSKLCSSNKSKKVEFSLREITQGSNKKTYGPYVGEMKKLKKPIELKGRIIRHEIKLHLKKGKSSTIKTAKKMRGSGPFELFHSLNNYSNFVESEFQSNYRNNKSQNYEDVKRGIISEINETRKKRNRNNLFYIYQEDNIISIGVIDREPLVINGELYLYILYLLSREKRNRGGINAIYHLLSRLPEQYNGICLYSNKSAISFYKHLGFNRNNKEKDRDKYILNKENLPQIKAKLPHPITTEFYSTYPDNIIT